MGILLASSLTVTGVAALFSMPQKIVAAEQTIHLDNTTVNSEQTVSGGAVTSGGAVASGEAIVSEPAMISLWNVPSALYKWYYQIEDSSIIKVKDKGYKPEDCDMSGGGGTQTFSVEGLKEGTTKIYFVNTRKHVDDSWSDYRVYQIQVNADLSVTVQEEQRNKKAKYLCVGQDSSTGYEVECVVEDTKVVSVEKREYFPPDAPSDSTPTLGDSGFVVYEVLAQKQGTTNLSFYKQTADGKIDSKSKISYKASVNKNGTLTLEQIITQKASSSAKKPAKVKKVTTKRTSAKKATVSIKKVSGATGYQVTYATDKKFKKNKKSVFTKKNKVTLKSLKKGKTYYVKVRAYKTAEGTKNYGSYSKVVTIKMK